MTIKEHLLSLGMLESDIDNHCSDLYVKVTEISNEWLKNYEFNNLVTTFIDNIDQTRWYEIPFGYSEYFEEKMR